MHTSASKSASPKTASSELVSGALVEYSKDDKACLAVVQEPDGKRNWWVVDQSGRRSSIHPRQVTFVIPGVHSGAAVEEVQGMIDGADMSLLEIAWDICDDRRPRPLMELSDLLFSDTAPRAMYLTLRMLRADKVYFKQASKQPPMFEAKAKEDVEAAQKAIAAEARRRAEMEAWRKAADEVLKGKAEPFTPEGWLQGPHARYVAALKALAVQGEECRQRDVDVATEALSLLAGDKAARDKDAARRLCVALGILRRHEPLGALRAGIAPFPPSLEEKAQALASSPPPDADAASRMDLTHLAVFALDDPGTAEVDDGVSIEPGPGPGSGAGAGPWLWVHVADPTRWLTDGPRGEFAQEAARRTRTLYFPWGTHPMIPRTLGEGVASLSGGQERCALSVGCRLGADGELAEWRVAPSLVCVSHALTYEEADQQLLAGIGSAGEAEEHKNQLWKIYEAALARQAWRRSRGSIEIDVAESKTLVPEADLDAERPRVSVTGLRPWESPSRTLVAEMMILAGEAIGKFGAERELPLPYRGQPAPSLPPPELLSALPRGPCQGFALRRCMTRSTVEGRPQRHAALALDAYVQITSPIRRYGDLLAHWQVKAALRGEQPPLGQGELESLMTAAGARGRDLNRVEGDVDKYWLAEYLQQQGNRAYVATVVGAVRPDLGLYAVVLDELGVESVVRLRQSAVPGEVVEVALLEARPLETPPLIRFIVTSRSGDNSAELESNDSAPPADDDATAAAAAAAAAAAEVSAGIAEEEVVVAAAVDRVVAGMSRAAVAADDAL